MNFTTYIGNDIANAFDCLGVPCKFIKSVSGCTTTKYYFDLLNLNQLPKIKNAVKLLSAHMHENIVLHESKISHFCIEIEHERVYPTYSQTWYHIEKYNTPAICFGYDENMTALVRKVEDLPHMLVAGTTGSGKSTFLNSVILDLHYNNDVSMLLIDPKQVEFSRFKNSHKLWMPIITSVDNAIKALNILCQEMDNRFKILKQNNLTDNSTYKFYPIVCIVDELADLMLTSGKAVEEPIVRLAQKGRACGIHLILATQRPTVNVVTGLIKANMPCRVAFATASNRDSMTMLDKGGAEKLLGKGDCLVKLPDQINLIRIQAPYVSSEEITEIMPATPREWKNPFNRELAGLSQSSNNKASYTPIHPPKTSWLDKLLGKAAKRRENAQNGAKNGTTAPKFSTDELNFYDCVDDED